MKQNRKNKKLTFIRLKNRMRDGELPFSYFKISDSDKNVPNREDQIKQGIREGWELIKKKWRLKFNFDRFEIKIACTGSDFIDELVTVRVKYFK